MAVVQSLGAIADLQPAWSATASYGSLRVYGQHTLAYGELYRQQPNVRTCVDFLARNIAQLGLHTYRRVSETDRQRVRDHPLAVLIGKPNPFTTRYRLIESLIADMGIYFNAYWLKVSQGNGQPALLRLPPTFVSAVGDLQPQGYELNFSSGLVKKTTDEIVHFRGYNPSSGTVGLSPLETLRRVLAEEYAAGDYREHFWRNAARMNGVIERPADAPEWSDTARKRFTSEFEQMYAGEMNSGKTAVLEEGMSWKQNTFSAQESEYLAARKLTREECARAYHIPLPMVGILDNANFSNMQEAHKQLYQDCLGPWLAMIEEDVALQLLPWLGDVEGVYCEFNIQEKLQGSFLEQTQSYSTAVGRPWMTADEARARANMPSLGGDAERLVTPLNVLIGGQASPRDSAPPKASLKALKAAAELDPTLAETRARHGEKWAQVLAAYFGRQSSALIGRVSDGASIDAVWEDPERWDSELGTDLFRLNAATAQVWAKWVSDQLGAVLDVDRMHNYLEAVATNSAGRINATTRDQVAAALKADVPKDAFRHVFEIAAGSRAEEIGQAGVTGAANFGSHEGAKQGGLRTKTWQTSASKDPREDHAAMSGETVGIGDLFSNGMRWPGDPAGGPENNAYCGCSVAFGRE